MKYSARTVMPAARSQGLVVEHLGGEALIYDLERDEAHHLNPTAAAVFALCDGQTTAEQLATSASRRLGRPLSAQTVDEAVDQLARRGLLGRAPPPSVRYPGARWCARLPWWEPGRRWRGR